MKAFKLYSRDEIQLRKLLRKMQDYGTVNCTFEQFIFIYTQCHLSTFKGQPLDFSTASFRDDWFRSFVEYIANFDI